MLPPVDTDSLWQLLRLRNNPEKRRAQRHRRLASLSARNGNNTFIASKSDSESSGSDQESVKEESDSEDGSAKPTKTKTATQTFTTTATTTIGASSSVSSSISSSVSSSVSSSALASGTASSVPHKGLVSFTISSSSTTTLLTVTRSTSSSIVTTPPAVSTTSVAPPPPAATSSSTSAPPVLAPGVGVSSSSTIATITSAVLASSSSSSIHSTPTFISSPTTTFSSFLTDAAPVVSSSSAAPRTSSLITSTSTASNGALITSILEAGAVLGTPSITPLTGISTVTNLQEAITAAPKPVEPVIKEDANANIGIGVGAVSGLAVVVGVVFFFARKYRMTEAQRRRLSGSSFSNSTPTLPVAKPGPMPGTFAPFVASGLTNQEPIMLPPGMTFTVIPGSPLPPPPPPPPDAPAPPQQPPMAQMSGGGMAMAPSPEQPFVPEQENYMGPPQAYGGESLVDPQMARMPPMPPMPAGVRASSFYGNSSIYPRESIPIAPPSMSQQPPRSGYGQLQEGQQQPY